MASKETYLEIVNNTRLHMNIHVNDTDDHDWDGDSRPDHNLQNVIIEPYSSKKVRAELNTDSSSAWFTMNICIGKRNQVTIGNGDNIEIRNDQWDAVKTYQRIHPLSKNINDNDYIAFQNNISDSLNRFIISSKAWVNDIPDNKYINELTIPGTHDTCATSPVPYSKCQDKNLEDQLELGIRYLDIRCRMINDEFAIHHGRVFEDINFDQVQDICFEFLKKHPNEFILMSVKKEHTEENCNKSFEEILRNYINPNIDRYYIEREFPRVKDVRGKIVIISRYEDSTIGIDANPKKWGDDTTFSIESSKIRVQDVYNVPIIFDKKWTHVWELLEEADKGKSDWLFLNFCSGFNFGFPTSMKLIAHKINDKLFEHCTTRVNKRYGVLIMDFPTYPNEALVRSLISLNYN